MAPDLIAIAVFAAVYAAIVSERVDRTASAMAGAVLVVLLGVVTQEQAIRAIDLNTVGPAGRDDDARRHPASDRASFATRRSGSRGWPGAEPWRITLLFVLFTAVASAFLDNVTTVLLMPPMTLTIAGHLQDGPSADARVADRGLERWRHGNADRRSSEHHNRQRDWTHV